MTITADGILIAVLTAFGGFLIRYIWDKLVKKAETTKEQAAAFELEQLEDHISTILDTKLVPINAQLQKFHSQCEIIQNNFEIKRKNDLDFYKFQLINACKKYQAQGWVTQYQFDGVSEIHRIYHNLGGNNQGDEYYSKTLDLPIISEAEAKKRKLVKFDDEDDLYVNQADMIDIHDPKNIDLYELKIKDEKKGDN